MSGPVVRVLFYGSFMDTDLLTQRGVTPRDTIAARLEGWALIFQPMANVIPASDEEVWGIVATVDGGDLDSVYVGDPLSTYAPLEVEVHTVDGATEVVDCYAAPALSPVPPSADYLGLLVAAAREHGLPDPWIERLARVRAG